MSRLWWLRMTLHIFRAKKFGRVRKHLRIWWRDRRTEACLYFRGRIRLFQVWRNVRTLLALLTTRSRISGRRSHRFDSSDGSGIATVSTRLLLLSCRLLGTLPTVSQVDESRSGQAIAPVGVWTNGQPAGEFAVEKNWKNSKRTLFNDPSFHFLNKIFHRIKIYSKERKSQFLAISLSFSIKKAICHFTVQRGRNIEPVFTFNDDVFWFGSLQ